MTASIAERVAAGAAWLDENRPGWVERIDLETLDLTDPCGCVLGQEYGNFWTSPAALGTALEFAARSGFYADGETEENNYDEYASLTAEWRRLITARRVLTS